MKTATLFIATFLLFISCKKNNTTGDTVLLEVPYPHQWDFTADASADKYTYLELAGNNMKQSEVLKSYSLKQLAVDNYREFNVAEPKTEFTNKLCNTIQFERQGKRWLFAAPSTNRQEVHLGTTFTGSETAGLRR